MNRRTFMSSTSLSLAALSTKTAKAENAENLVTTPAVIMALRHDGAEVVWGVSRLAQGSVEWRDQSGAHGFFHRDDFGFTPQNAHVLKVKLRGLKSGTQYKVRAVTEAIDGAAEKVVSPWKSFRTLANSEQADCHFVVWNDTHEHDSTIKRLHEVITRPEMRDAPYKIVFCHIPLRHGEEPENIDYAHGAYDHYARSSRDLWHESLVNWGAQLIISGHTHRQSWLPANEKFPYAQLIGGGLKEKQARLIEGKATSADMTLSLKDLRGNVTFETRLMPV